MTKECGCGNPEGSNSECERCRLISQINALADVLCDLVDSQAGPPYYKHREKWRATMDRANDELRKAGR